ncbi:cupin domain-containing protein [Saccharopolyspora sp. NPDC003762]
MVRCCVLPREQHGVWIVPAEGEPVQIDPGDIAIIRGPAPHLVADDPGTRPQAVITSDYWAPPRPSTAPRDWSGRRRQCYDMIGCASPASRAWSVRLGLSLRYNSSTFVCS